MLEMLTEARQDPILSLAAAYQNDARPEKMDLGVGVYRDETGVTPIMRAVKAAQLTLAQEQASKAYLGLGGNESFNRAIIHLLLGSHEASSRTTALQTPGASGALRLIAELIACAKPQATVWLSTPNYVNHQPIMQSAGLKTASYRYFNPQSKQVDEQAMLDDIAQLGKDDILLLHGCCHNPTGADISANAWQRIAELAQQNGFIPFIDLAYQGLGDGIEEDCYGIRTLSQLPELLIATSCSKSFGLYRERTGAALVVGQTMQHALNANHNLQALARQSYTMPPDHGAAIVEHILNTPALCTMWQDELNQMRTRLVHLRHSLVKTLQQTTQSDRFDYLQTHKGMFSVTGVTQPQIKQLKEAFGIYVVAGGRINIAGLQEQHIPYLSQALVEVGA